MLSLSLVWLAGGCLVGALGCAAALRLPWPRRGGPWRAWGLVALGAAAGLVGGWIGTGVFGTFFGSPTAAWVAVLVVVGVPWGARRQEASRAPERERERAPEREPAPDLVANETPSA